MKKKILIVDDDAMIRKLLAALLSYHGCEVKVVANGRKAYETIMEETDGAGQVSNLVITDLEMPEMSGGELAGKIKDLNAFMSGSNIKVILMSGNNNELHRIRKSALCKNIDAFVLKPFDPNSLLMEVENLLR